MTNIILGAYGIFLLLGAFMGLKAGSKISLIMGLVSGAFVLISLYIAQSNPAFGFKMLTLITGVLTGMFLQRLIKTEKFMPSGMLLITSLIALIVSLKHII